MTMGISPENTPIIYGLAPCAASVTGDTADAICLKNAKGVLIIAMHGGTANNDITLSVHEGATAAEAQAGTYALAATFPLWLNLAPIVSDELAKTTDAATYQIDSDLGTNQMVVFYVSSSKLTSGRSWVSLGFDAGHASNFFAVLYILDGERYQQATPPTAIV